MNWQAEIIATGLAFPEGPIYHGPNDISVVEIHGGTVARIRDGAIAARWSTQGGPNGATPGADGSLYVANNGGKIVAGTNAKRSAEELTGRIQRVALDGTVTDLAIDIPGSTPHAPNDLCFGPDGLLYFTDPRWMDVGPDNPGALHRTDREGRVEQIATVDRFPNGIGFGPDDRLYIAESMTRRILVYDWTKSELSEASVFAELPRGYPDGFCFDGEGLLIVCGSMEDTICVFDRDGRLSDRFDTPEGSHPTNCCLGGGRLWVTYSGTGELVAFEYDTPALPLYDETGERRSGAGTTH